MTKGASLLSRLVFFLPLKIHGSPTHDTPLQPAPALFELGVGAGFGERARNRESTTNTVHIMVMVSII